MLFNSQNLPVGVTYRHHGMPEVILFFDYHHRHVIYRTPCRASGHLDDFGDQPASSKASLGPGSSTLMLTGLCADLRNIAPARLFV